MPQSKGINSSVLSLLYGPLLTSIHDYWKTIALTRWTFVSKVMSLLFNILSRFVISFLQRRKHLLILWLQVPSAVIFSSVQFSCSVVSDSLRHHELQHARPPVHHQLPEFTQIHVRRAGDAIQPCHPLSSPSPPAPNPSQHQRFFSNESTLRMRWPKYWSFSFSIIPSKENPGLISFRMDWLDLLAVQGTPRVFSSTTVQRHQFFGFLPSLWSRSHNHT